MAGNDENSFLKNIGESAEKMLSDINVLSSIIQRIIHLFDSEAEKRKDTIEFSVIETVRSISESFEVIVMEVKKLKTNEQRENLVDQLHSINNRLSQLSVLLAELDVAKDAPCVNKLEHLRVLIVEARKALLKKIAIDIKEKDVNEQIKNINDDAERVQKLKEKIAQIMTELDNQATAAREELDSMKKKQKWLKVYITLSTICQIGGMVYNVVGGMEGMRNTYSWFFGPRAETTGAASGEAVNLIMRGTPTVNPTFGGMPTSSITEVVTGMASNFSPQVLLSFGQFAMQSSSLMMLMNTYQEQGESMLDNIDNVKSLYTLIQNLNQHMLAQNMALLDMLKQKKELLSQLSQLKDQSIGHVGNEVVLINKIRKLIESLTAHIDTSAVDTSCLSAAGLELLKFIRTHNDDVAKKVETEKEMAKLLEREPKEIKTITLTTSDFVGASNKQSTKERKKAGSNVHTLADLKEASTSEETKKTKSNVHTFADLEEASTPKEEINTVNTTIDHVSANRTVTMTVSTQQYTEGNHQARREKQEKVDQYFANRQQALSRGDSKGEQALQELINPEKLQEGFRFINNQLNKAEMERRRRRDESEAGPSDIIPMGMKR